jgi:uncharacterized protein
MDATELLVAVAIAVGIAGVVVPVLPGALLVLAAILVWALHVGSATGWAVLGIAAVVLAVGAVVKYVVPGRRLKAAGVPTRTLVSGGALGIVGFFVVPVVGLFAGFVLGVWLSELQRVGRAAAWPSTVHALKASGLSLLIELTSVLVAATVWAVGVSIA